MPSTPLNDTDPFFGVPERLAELVVRYYDGGLSDDGLSELHAGLETSPAARELFVQWGLQAQTLTEALSPQYREADEPVSFEGLVEMEASAQAELVSLDERSARSAKADPVIQEDAGSLSAHDLAAVGGYALRLALTSKPAKRIYAYVGVAAALALALVLLNPWGGSETPGNAPLATGTPNTPFESPPTIPRDQPVAALA